jgi:drug/metabolite transporter (DMT)-like permease
MLLVIAIWGGFLPVGKSALQAVDPYWLTAMRFGTAALVFLVLLRPARRRATSSHRRPPWKILFFGACGFAGFGICLFEGLRLTRPEISAMILALGPIQVALVQWWRTHRRPDNFTLAMIALALVGELLVVTSGNWRAWSAATRWATAWSSSPRCSGPPTPWAGSSSPSWSPVRYTALSCSLGCLGIAAA